MRRVWLVCLFSVLLPVKSLAEPEIDLKLLNGLQGDVDQNKPKQQLFDDFKHIFNRKYDTTEEEMKRKAIFMDRVDFIRKHNVEYRKGAKTFSLGVNKFSDVSHKEFLEMYTIRRWQRTKNKTQEHDTNNSPPILERRKRDADSSKEIPDILDWRHRGFTTSIGDQGDCGSCWAFGVAGAVEAQVMIHTGKLVQLSVQQMVDCDSSNLGCNGGVLQTALDYIKKAGGLQRQADYPYKAIENVCQFDRNKTVDGSHVKGFKYLPPRNGAALKETLALVGPTITAIDLNPEEYMSYSKGIFYIPSCSLDHQNLDHAVLVVGYGTEPEDYWLIKNSMGTSWGEQGYMHMARSRGNDCGVTRQAIIPLMTGGTRLSSLNIVEAFVVISMTILRVHL